MAKTILIDNIPDEYQQPDNKSANRVVQNYKESINFTSHSHVRIWYNNSTDGYSLHSHEAFEVCIVVKGTYEIHVNTEKNVLQAGDILIIPPNTLHEYVNDTYGIRFIYLIEMKEFCSSHDYKVIEPLFFNAFLCNKKTCPDIYDNVYKLFMDMNSVYFTNTNFWETTVYSKFYQVFVEISRHTINAVKDETTNLSQSMKRINSIMHYVDTHYTEEITTEQAAEYTGFSKYHFLRLFKLHTGYTFHDYLTWKRIQVAEDLLMDDIPITDIAFQSGFNTLTSFCRAFKKYTNYSPTEYKKLRKETIERTHK